MSHSVKVFIDRYALFLAIVVGAIGFPWFHLLTPLLPYMIFLMLFFTFCKVNPLDLRLHKWHWMALLGQAAWAFGSYYLLIWAGRYVVVLADQTIAQTVMLCFLMPTATAAPIIAGKLGGSIQNLTTYTLLCNFFIALVVPMFFPVVNPSAHITFWVAALLITRKITPLLLVPFLAAWALRLSYDCYQRIKHSDKRFSLSPSWAECPFYLWAGTIVILTADMTYMLIHSSYSVTSLVCMSVGATLSCLLQFYMGRWIGKRWPASSHGTDYQDVVVNPQRAPKDSAGISRITAGQALGQKNTTLAIWMAQTYLLPLAAIGPAVYMIVQNIFNSVQLGHAAKPISRL